MAEFICSICGQPMQGDECRRCRAATSIAKPEDAAGAKVTPHDGAIREGEPTTQPKPPEPWPYKHEPGPGCGYGCLGNLVLGILASAALFVFAFPVCQNVHNARIRTQTMNNMKTLALACHWYHDVHKQFPSPRSSVIKDGNPIEVNLSWRVAILPMMDHRTLFDQFDKTVGWDHEGNMPMKEQMPTDFESPFSDPWFLDGETKYQYFTGPGTLFPSNDPVGFRDIKDGSSITFLFAEAGQSVTWTRPADMIIKPDQPLPLPEIQFHAAFADGTVRVFSRDSTSDTVLRQLIHPNDQKPDPGWDN